MTHLVLRVVLFAPGNHARRVEKAYQLQADAVILDLEDAVAPLEKEHARHLIAATVSSRGGAEAGPRTVVRINHPSTGLADADLQATLLPGVDMVMLAKTESAEEIQWLAAQVARLEAERGIPAGWVRLFPIIETARGILESRAIAAASPRVAALAFGGLDFTQDIGTSLSEDGSELLLARSQLVLASRAAGVAPPIDTVFPWLDDRQRLLREARRARQLGFQGKLVIHPDQVAPVREVFSPTEEEVGWARKVLEAFEGALRQGSAVINVDGKFIDRPIVLWAERVLAMASLR